MFHLKFTGGSLHWNLVSIRHPGVYYSETDQKYSGRMVLGGRCGTGTGVYQVGVS